MKLFKSAIILSILVLISTVAWAGNTPEYDAVGCDVNNFFSKTVAYYDLVNHGPFGDLQAASSFYPETFNTNAGQLVANPCWDYYARNAEVRAPYAALTDVWNQGTYTWRIVLQMKPESDINLNIYDCVFKHNETNLFGYADQTGRFRQPWGELEFWPLNNPLVAANAFPGPYATAAFAASGGPMILDARTLPGLVNVALDGISYTSKAHWPEGIVMALPKTGSTNESGQMEYNLKQGDIIQVTVEIPDMTNTVDLWYGPDSVILKYIGIVNTEYFGSYCDYDS